MRAPLLCTAIVYIVDHYICAPLAYCVYLCVHCYCAPVLCISMRALLLYTTIVYIYPCTTIVNINA